MTNNKEKAYLFRLKHTFLNCKTESKNSYHSLMPFKRKRFPTFVSKHIQLILYEKFCFNSAVRGNRKCHRGVYEILGTKYQY